MVPLRGQGPSDGELGVPLTWMLGDLQCYRDGEDTACTTSKLCQDIVSFVGSGINMVYIPTYKRNHGGLLTPWVFINFVNSGEARRAMRLLSGQRWLAMGQRWTEKLINIKPAHVQGFMANAALRSQVGVDEERSLFLFDVRGKPVDLQTALGLYGLGNTCVQQVRTEPVRSVAPQASSPSSLKHVIRMYGLPRVPFFSL
mmetsp:Transcript_92254/g.238110  ORF Transcript_92254/g.238110 Transcript_92254/m.238110 type:complete len:200 (-) Transcript_92254:222-821(-)